MTFTRAQVEQLLRPINPDRVLRDGKGHSHVSQQDVLAHLIRVFGFGNFDTEILSGPTLLFETERTNSNGEPTGRWDVCYSCTYRLIIKDQNGREVCHFEDGSTATAQNQTRGDGHDLAFKSALSLAKKRAAIPLGDQFGLSLYNKGQLAALVRGTIVLPDGQENANGRDMQDGVPKQVAMGNDEIDRETPAEPVRDAPVQRTDHKWLDNVEARIKVARSRAELAKLADEIRAKKAAGQCEQVHEDHLWEVGKKRQEIVDSGVIDGTPVNQDGSVSRSRMTDEERTAAGIPAKAEVRADNKANRELWATGDTGKKAERSGGVDENDPWATAGTPGGEPGNEPEWTV
jgi:hypothetical protein